METNLISVDEFCAHYNVETNFISSLEEYGLVKTKLVNKAIFINADDLNGLEKYIRLYKELEINLEGLHAVSHLLSQVEFLQIKLHLQITKLAATGNYISFGFCSLFKRQ